MNVKDRRGCAALTRRVRADAAPRSTRRVFLITAAVVPALALGLLAWPHGVRAQQPARVPRIGALAGQPQRQAAFRQGLRDLGWIEGKNIVVEYQAIDAPSERFARELVGRKVDCIVASGNAAISMLKELTSDIPIVMAFAADAVGSGFVASLSRPGGNITGLININEALTGKRLELLKELNPRISRVALLKNPAISAHAAMWKDAQSSARSLGLRVFAVDYRSAEEFEAAFAVIARGKAEGLVVPGSPVVNSGRARIASLAAKARLPAVYQDSFFVEAGGLMSYGPDGTDLWRRSAAYVDKILKGAKPADLPVEQPTKFELMINRKTANALGIKIPQALLMRAEKVLE